VLSGILISRGSSTTNHLFLVDDSLLFCRSNLRECKKIKEVLNCYEAASG